MGRIPRHFCGKTVFWTCWKKNTFSESRIFRPLEIDQISDREMGSDEYVLEKMTFRIEELNPMHIVCEKVASNEYFVRKVQFMCLFHE